MRKLLPASYLLALALLFGGNALYTFLATPAVFKAFDRALAGDVVSAMMPGYFGWSLVLWGVALAVGCLLLLKSGSERGRVAAYTTLALLAAGAVSAAAVMLWLYPAMLEVRAQVPSFAADAPIGPARAAFRKLHGISMALNLLQFIASGVLVGVFAGRGVADK
jgi:hypothetical protein